MAENLEAPRPATYDDPRPTGRLRWLKSKAENTVLLQAEWQVATITLTGQTLRKDYEWRDVPTVEVP